MGILKLLVLISNLVVLVSSSAQPFKKADTQEIHSYYIQEVNSIMLEVHSDTQEKSSETEEAHKIMQEEQDEPSWRSYFTTLVSL